MRVVLIEDDRKIASFARKGLSEQGFLVEHCEEGEEGLHLATSTACDVVLLDIMLPGRDGLSILRSLREEGHTVPVILLTARSTLNERVDGLNLGADDYLCKPFFIEELVARIHAVVRRTSGKAMNLLSCGGIVLDRVSRTVTADDHDVELTVREFSLLELLMRSPERVFTRTQILEHVWGYDFDPQTNVVDVYIRRIRKKLESACGDRAIETIRGVGYRMNPKSGGGDPCSD